VTVDARTVATPEVLHRERIVHEAHPGVASRYLAIVDGDGDVGGSAHDPFSGVDEVDHGESVPLPCHEEHLGGVPAAGKSHRRIGGVRLAVDRPLALPL